MNNNIPSSSRGDTPQFPIPKGESKRVEQPKNKEMGGSAAAKKIQELDPSKIREQEAAERFDAAEKLFKLSTADGTTAALNNLRSAANLGHKGALLKYNDYIKLLLERSAENDPESSYILHRLYPDHPAEGFIKLDENKAKECLAKAQEMTNEKGLSKKEYKDNIPKILEQLRTAAMYGSKIGRNLFNSMAKELINQGKMGYLETLYPVARPIKLLTPAADVTGSVGRSPLHETKEEVTESQSLGTDTTSKVAKQKKKVGFKPEVKVMSSSGEEVSHPTTEADRLSLGPHQKVTKNVLYHFDEDLNKVEQKDVKSEVNKTQAMYKSANPKGSYKKAGVGGEGSPGREISSGRKYEMNLKGYVNCPDTDDVLNEKRQILTELATGLLENDNAGLGDVAIAAQSIIFGSLYKAAKVLNLDSDMRRSYCQQVATDIAQQLLNTLGEGLDKDSLLQRVGILIRERNIEQTDTLTRKEFIELSKNPNWSFFNSPDRQALLDAIDSGEWKEGEEREMRIAPYDQEQLKGAMHGIRILFAHPLFDRLKELLDR